MRNSCHKIFHYSYFIIHQLLITLLSCFAGRFINISTSWQWCASLPASQHSITTVLQCEFWLKILQDEFLDPSPSFLPSTLLSLTCFSVHRSLKSKPSCFQAKALIMSIASFRFIVVVSCPVSWDLVIGLFTLLAHPLGDSNQQSKCSLTH